MTPHKQLFRHDPATGTTGDCWRTSIGCLLDLPPAEVPHFVDGHWNDAVATNAIAREWLARYGLGFVECAYLATLEEVLASVGAVNPGHYYLLGGNSRNGTGHSVVCCDDRVVWDPSLDDTGIVAPMEDGHYWVTWLVPLLIVKGTQ